MSSPASPVSAKPWSLRAKLGLQLLLILLAAFSVEGGYRLFLLARGEGYGARSARARLVELASPMRDPLPQTLEPADATPAHPAQAPGQERLILHPFYAFENALSIQSLENELFGFRHGEYGDEYKIAVIGGSVAGIFGVRGSEKLCALLEADPRLAGRKVHVFGHGRGSFKQPQQLNLVNYLLASGGRYDAIINLDGFNEVALSGHNLWEGASPIYPSVFRWAHLAQGAKLEAADLDLLSSAWSARREGLELAQLSLADGRMHSAILGRARLRRMDRIRARWAQAQESYGKRLLERDADFSMRGPRFEGDHEAMLAAVVVGWVESSRSLQALCDARGMSYLHVLQPTLHDKGSKPLTPQELASDNAHQSWIEAVGRGYPMLRAAGASLRAAQVNFLDASMIFKDTPQTLYFDACHFRAPGVVMLAEQVAARFLEVMREPARAR